LGEIPLGHETIANGEPRCGRSRCAPTQYVVSFRDKIAGGKTELNKRLVTVLRRLRIVLAACVFAVSAINALMWFGTNTPTMPRDCTEVLRSAQESEARQSPMATMLRRYAEECQSQNNSIPRQKVEVATGAVIRLFGPVLVFLVGVWAAY
jgi:hypothetical protein